MKLKLIILEIFKVIIIGINSVISTSKIKKITAIKKKCNENGVRADLLGSNPHSNGDLFSRSKKLFFEIIEERIIKILQIIKIIDLMKKIILIIYTKFY